MNIAVFLTVSQSMIEPEEINYIDFELMKVFCHPIAVDLFNSSKEPIPVFDKHEKEKLESALGNARQSYYPTFTKKAAILYYSLIKNHPFLNGNKRIATATLIVFLLINDFDITGMKQHVEDYLIDLAIRVSKSEGSKDKEDFLVEIENWLNSNIKPTEKD